MPVSQGPSVAEAVRDQTVDGIGLRSIGERGRVGETGATRIASDPGPLW